MLPRSATIYPYARSWVHDPFDGTIVYGSWLAKNLWETVTLKFESFGITSILVYRDLEVVFSQFTPEFPLFLSTQVDRMFGADSFSHFAPRDLDRSPMLGWLLNVD